MKLFYGTAILGNLVGTVFFIHAGVTEGWNIDIVFGVLLCSSFGAVWSAAFISEGGTK